MTHSWGPFFAYDSDGDTTPVKNHTGDLIALFVRQDEAVRFTKAANMYDSYYVQISGLEVQIRELRAENKRLKAELAANEALSKSRAKLVSGVLGIANSLSEIADNVEAEVERAEQLVKLMGGDA